MLCVHLQEEANKGKSVWVGREGEDVTVEESMSGKYAPEKLDAIKEAVGGAIQWAVKESAMTEKEKALRLLEAQLTASH